MTILDLDLDAFVLPVVHWKVDNDPRPSDNDHEVASQEWVHEFLHARCRLDGSQKGAAREHHLEALAVIAHQIEIGALTPPFSWVHIDAHDDFWGHFSKPPNSGNFLYHCIKRKWISDLTMVFPPNVFDFPNYILRENPLRVEFEGNSVPLEFSDTNTYQLNHAPHFVFLARSPAFTPPKADALFNSIQALFYNDDKT